MNKFRNKGKIIDESKSYAWSQQGAALIIALFILTVLSMLGVTSMASTQLSYMMSRNHADADLAFHQAESIRAMTGKMLPAFIARAELASEQVFMIKEGDLNGQVTVTAGNVAAAVGSGLAQAQGYVGSGVSSGRQGSVMKYYEMHVEAKGPRNSASQLAVDYRYVD